MEETPQLPLDRRSPTGRRNTPEADSERYVLKPGYAIRAFMDEFLVIPVGAPGADDAKMAVLSPVGEFIWSQLSEPRSFEELLVAVTDEFDVTPDVAGPDIRAFLADLDKHNFLLNGGKLE